MSGLKLTSTQRQRLQEQLRQTHDAERLRRTLAILDFSRGESVARIAGRLGVTRRSVYSWIAAYNAWPHPVALATEPRSGRPPLWTEQTQQALRILMNGSPQNWRYPATEWTVPLLAEALESLVARRFSRNTIRWGLRQLDYVWKRPRLSLAPDPEREKKTPHSEGTTQSRPAWRYSGTGRNRPADVSAVARRLDQTWPIQTRVAVGI